MKKITVRLKDYINPSEQGDKIELEYDISKGETAESAAKKKLIQMYGGNTKSAYIEKHEHNGNYFKMCFNTNSDFFIMWRYIPKEEPA